MTDMSVKEQLLRKSAGVLERLGGSYSHLFAAMSMFNLVSQKLLNQPRLVSSGWSADELAGICLLITTRLLKDLKTDPDELAGVYFKGKLRVIDLAKMTVEVLQALDIQEFGGETAYDQAKRQARRMCEDGQITERDYIRVCKKMADIMLTFLSRSSPNSRDTTLVFMLLKNGLRVLEDRHMPSHFFDLQVPEFNSFTFELVRVVQSEIKWEHSLNV